MLVLRKILAALILPPFGLLLALIAGLLLRRRWPRAAMSLAWCAVVGLVLLCWPPVAEMLVRSLYDGGPLDLERARDAQAIVILGGGLRGYAPEYPAEPDLGKLSLDRLRYGALLARRSGLPVLLSGGGGAVGEAPEADVMARVLEQEFGVVPRWVENKSRNTHENAVLSADILRRAGVSRIILVVHAFDVPRARREFDGSGLHVVPAPTYLAPAPGEMRFDQLPSAAALQMSYYACYELLAGLIHDLGWN